MHKFKLPAIALFLVVSVLTLLSCDDRNIVEPRFYDADKLGVTIHGFNGHAYAFGLPDACPVGLYLLGSAGQVVRVFYDGEQLAAGTHYVNFDERDDNGDKLQDGVYCFLLRACGYAAMACFEYDDREDNLP